MKKFKDQLKTINKANNFEEIKNDDQTMRQIIIKDKNNNTKEGKIIFSFVENGDEYVIYELDNQAFGAKIDENNNLHAINDDEWPLVEKIYDQYCEENENTQEE